MPHLFSNPPLCPTLSFLLFVLLLLLPLLSLHLHPLSPFPTPSPSLLFLSSSSNSTLSSLLRSLSLRPHLAPSLPISFHPLPTHSVPLRPLLSYPLRSSLSLSLSLLPNSSSPLPLHEWGPLPLSPDGVVIPYHAFSPSGSARAQPIFANFGRPQDYRALARLGVSVAGRIVLARKGGGLSRADAAEIAAARGAAALLTYAEGSVGFERGTVAGMSEGPGDPLSPGWPTGGETAEEPEASRRFPKIPSLPLSLELAEGILGTLGGAPVPNEWRSSMKTRINGVGPGPRLLDFEYQV